MARTAAHATPGLPGWEEYGLSPIRRQYLELKRRCPGAILFFRLGDFYETFEEDARLVARVLDLALTSREMGRGERLPMAGLPAHAADGHVAKLVACGHHVAIAEQVGEVARGGLVRREIVRIVTPGTVMEDGLLLTARDNFLLALVQDRKVGYGIAYLDVTTGQFEATEVLGHGAEAEELVAAELVRVGPAECVVEESSEARTLIPPASHQTPRGPDLFSPATGIGALARRFGGTVEGFGLADTPLALRAAGALLQYVQEARPSAAATLQPPRLYSPGRTMVLDRATRANLDLLETESRGGATLVSQLDDTTTAMGARLLRRWVGQPLLDVERIQARLDSVEWLVRDGSSRARLREALRGLPDLERLAVRAGQELLAPRECLAVALALESIPAVHLALGSAVGMPPLMSGARDELLPLADVASDVRATVAESATVFGDGTIRQGVSAELDELRSLTGDTRRWIARLEARERERSGVRALKVGYNRIFGYYLEVSTAQCAQPTDYYQRQSSDATTVGEHLERLGYTRKQTLSNAERFVTGELKEMEARVGRAQEESLRLERDLYTLLLGRLRARADDLARTARALALLDVLVSLADVAADRRFVRPLVDHSPTLDITGGRHPVVEAALPSGRFVPNDTRLGADVRMMLLTGPNMAGKSTYLRQVAVIVLMAQIGSFVPAERAHVGVVDRIFSRIGAHDDIQSGRSTFMVEMTEAAAILRAAGRNSLVILDEIGRGTSTYDGMAIARAILEDLHDDARPGGPPKTVFATHYHELTSLSDTLTSVRNYRVDVLERGDGVIFLHALVEGGADRSYGIHVAKLAGLPQRVTSRAWALLGDLETSANRAGASAESEVRLADTLASLDVLRMTPLDAHQALLRLQEQALSTPRG